ncbi:restriction endonuclease subunit S [Rodentibacter ratti]|uniref:Restriction endonuclease n=1 Tax=Rodentibacter ratti TaxID=1906745 RepID=A0A1V3LA23_9PAST|nr:restriction endonuclease subunit S [Rodentibacter ratti]OOF86801.1 restriction endonuclease [Rodentibacter ratti]
MTTETQLPQGWEIKKFGDVIDIQGGSQPPKSEFIYEPKENYIQLLQIRDFGENGIPTFVPKNRVTKFCDKDDILIARYGASLGRIVTGLTGAYNVALAKTIFDESILFKRFVYYLLQTQIFQLPLTMISRSAQNGFAKHEIAHIEIPIPPLETQQTIVNKIESLFAEIDAGIASLKNAEQQLVQYRQALLKNAFNGELTKAWREQNAETLPSAEELLTQIQTAREQHHAEQIKQWESAVKKWELSGKVGKKPSKPKALIQAVKFEEDFADLPRGWAAIKINQVADIFTGATPLKSNSSYYENGSIPWVTSGSLNNEFVSVADNFVTDLALKETNLRLLPKHTLLVAMYGEGKTRGKCSELLIEATTNQAIAGIVINEKFPINRKFLKFYMFKNYADIRRQSSGGVQPNLNLGLVGNIAFPFPCLAEQIQIVAILEQKLTACDQLTAELATQLKQAELLKQAVLKAAFSGRL